MVISRIIGCLCGLCEWVVEVVCEGEGHRATGLYYCLNASFIWNG